MSLQQIDLGKESWGSKLSVERRGIHNQWYLCRDGKEVRPVDGEYLEAKLIAKIEAMAERMEGLESIVWPVAAS